MIVMQKVIQSLEKQGKMSYAVSGDSWGTDGT